MKNIEKQKEQISSLIDYYQSSLTNFQEIKNEFITQSDFEKIATDIEVNFSEVDLFADLKKYPEEDFNLILIKLDELIEHLKNRIDEINIINEKWLPKYNAIKDEYNDFVLKSGENAETLENRRKKMDQELSDLRKEEQDLTKITSNYESLNSERSKLLDELDEVLDEIYSIRKRKYGELTELSQQKLVLDIDKAADRTAYIEVMQNLTKGSRLLNRYFQTIAEKFSPREFVDLVINEEYEKISDRVAIDIEKVRRIVDWFNDLEAQEKVLEIQYNNIPEDVPSIKFRLSSGEYKGITEISVGQRCTALLIIALISGDFPIVIDQPEESIDIAAVFDDIVTKLRTGKEVRQYILTTHNPNVAVTADSDLIHILKATADRGQIYLQGTIEDEDVCKEVIQHLEGGEEPYLLRGKKYGILGKM